MGAFSLAKISSFPLERTSSAEVSKPAMESRNTEAVFSSNLGSCAEVIKIAL
jgi:hypothetical protein